MGNNIGIDGVVGLAEAIMNTISLSAIDLSNLSMFLLEGQNIISSSGVDILIQALRINQSLTKLDLCNSFLL